MTAGDGEPPGADGASQEEQEPLPEVEHVEDGEPDVALDFDGEFARIVAAWGADPAPGVGPWPAQEDLDQPGDQAGGQAGDQAGPRSRRGDEDPSARGSRVVRQPRLDPGEPPVAPGVWRGSSQSVFPLEGAVDLPGPTPYGVDDEKGYVPPEPPPIGRGDLFSRLAWGAVLGGPLFLVLAVLFWQDLPQLLLLAALLAFVGGFVALVSRMPRDRDDNTDDGAVV